MNNKKLNELIVTLLYEKYGGMGNILIPPPVFTDMDGTILEYEQGKAVIKIKYPLNKRFANPFGKMQGGVIATAIDNTLGPLSMLVATLNYTRKLDVKYIKQIDVNDEFIIVKASVSERKSNRLLLEATVYDRDGCVMATAKATNWII